MLLLKDALGTGGRAATRGIQLRLLLSMVGGRMHLNGIPSRDMWVVSVSPLSSSMSCRGIAPRTIPHHPMGPDGIEPSGKLCDGEGHESLSAPTFSLALLVGGDEIGAREALDPTLFRLAFSFFACPDQC